jgi:hypothetical protein
MGTNAPLRRRFRLPGRLLVAALCAVLAPVAFGQDGILDAQDDTAAAADTVTWFGEAVLRHDHVEGLPPGRNDLDRTRGRVRLGANWVAMPTLEFGTAIELGAGSDDNADNRANNDNERSNGINLDSLFLRWRPADNTAVVVGKTAFPLELSPLTWDRDLRPAGISVDQSFAMGDFNRFSLTGGVFAGQHLYDDDSRIAALQAAWRWHEGAPTRAAVLLSYIDYSGLEQLTRQGLSRTNSRIGTRLVNDYRLVDLQLVGRTEWEGQPIEARLDVVRNVAADRARDGARFSLVFGTRLRAGGWELGYSNQRIQRDAVMAAFNEDDWWFHSFAHGWMPWLGYGVSENISVRLAGFHEMRDGLSEHTDRVLLDLEARW